MKIKLLVNGLLMAGLLAGCGSSSGEEVKAEDFGDAWPFTVESGKVDGARGLAAIFITEGREYQLNGVASSLGYQPINPIWRDNPKIPGTKVNIGPMIDLALEHC